MQSNLTNDLYGGCNSDREKWNKFKQGGKLNSVQLISGCVVLA